ncbi:septum formation initiator family protein [Arcanobacterium canis]|uniref:Septum formation initiator family protein n=1 Tax=Arcanobacterium canis TaxID=999183 RepID=A0ABY8FZC2_9ACTO|nr:septum formation initiator family protein [Arcanobacterium canis]WFM83667.1 septum formation initiator family protein [Arcanobacterium canis]
MNSRRPHFSSKHQSKQLRGSHPSAARRRTSAEHRSDVPHPERTRQRRGPNPALEEDMRVHALKPRPSKPGMSGRSPRERRRETVATGAQFTSKRYFVYQSGGRTRRFSVRALVVLIFIAIGVLIVASPLASYLNQQEQKRVASAELAKTTERVDQLERELDRWKDPKFVQTQARERLGYVLPGQTLYVVPRGGAETAAEKLQKQVKQVNDERRAATPFFITLRDSIAIAGKSGTQLVDNPSQVPVLNAPKPQPSSSSTQLPEKKTKSTK